MPADIAACAQSTCEDRMGCARYRMVRAERQVFASGWIGEIGVCTGLIPVAEVRWPLRTEATCVEEERALAAETQAFREVPSEPNG